MSLSKSFIIRLFFLLTAILMCSFGIEEASQPSRQSMLSGLYPHNYGSAGFFPMQDGVPGLPVLLGEAGYITSNINKTGHMMPEESFNWTFEARRAGYTNYRLGNSSTWVKREME